jgi:hypothetical protein
MKLTLDNLPQYLVETLARKAREEGRRVEEIAIDAMQRGLATNSPKRDVSDIVNTWVPDPVFDDAMKDFEQAPEEGREPERVKKNDLKRFSGTWVEDPEFDKAMELFEHIDSDEDTGPKNL